MIHLVTWNLNKEKPNYNLARENFLTELNKYTNKKDSSLDSVRFVLTHLSAESLYTILKTKIDENDRLVVVSVTRGQIQGWLDNDLATWVNSNI